MDTITIDGVDFVKSSKVADQLGYARDYVSQLCRSKAVPAHLVGRTWYVNKDSVAEHRVVKRRTVKAKARAQAKQILETHRQLKIDSQNTYKNIDISYETDDAPLVPNVRKIAVKSVVPRYSTHVDPSLKAPNYVVENEGKNIVMSGDLSVVDVTDGEVDDDTVFLQPTVYAGEPADSKPRHQQKTLKKLENRPLLNEDEDPVPPSSPVSFLERLESQDVISTDTDFTVENANPILIRSSFVYVFFDIMGIFVCVTSMLMLGGVFLLSTHLTLVSLKGEFSFQTTYQSVPMTETIQTIKAAW